MGIEEREEETLAGIVRSIVQEAGYASTGSGSGFDSGFGSGPNSGFDSGFGSGPNNGFDEKDKREYRLTAQIAALDDLSILNCIRYLKKLVDTPNIDVVVAELPSEISNNLKCLIESNENLDFRYVGHISLVLGYLMGKRQIPVFYGTKDDMPARVCEAKQELLSKGKQYLHQICSAENERYIKQVLVDKGFQII